MAKLRDLGHACGADKPFRLRVYRSTQLPLAHEAGPGALIYINDPDDGNPRGTLAVSNGASWDEQALKGEGTSPGGPAPVTGVALRELADLKLRLSSQEQAIGTLQASLQGGLRRLADAGPAIAASVAPVPVGPDASETAANSPRNDANSPDLLAALLPIERRLSEIEAALELEVLAELVVQAMGGDATAKALIAEEAAILGMSPEDHMAGVAATRKKRHVALMAARRERLAKG